MARKHRVEIPGGVVHVTARGNARAAIFLDAVDYLEFVRTLVGVVGHYGWLCHAYCAMPNHYHVLVETPEPNLARGMHRLNGRYARWFNGRHGRVGHLFQSRYHAEPVRRDEHLLESSRYIVLNPVRAGLCAGPEAWPWSSYRANADEGGEEGWVDIATVHALAGGAAGFRAFVRAGLPGEHPSP